MTSLKSLLISFSLVFLLAACGNDGVWRNAKDVFKAEFSAEAKVLPQTRKDIEEIPYATISAQLENTKSAMLVLAFVDNGTLQWFASNKVSLSTRNGRIVHSVGYEKDVSYLEVVGGDYLGDKTHDLKSTKSYQIVLETKSPKPASEVLNCVVNYKGEEKIVILDYSYDTVVLEEKCKSSQGWKVENLFWLDEETRFVWRSRQGVVNGKFNIEINVLKPYG